MYTATHTKKTVSQNTAFPFFAHLIFASEILRGRSRNPSFFKDPLLVDTHFESELYFLVIHKHSPFRKKDQVKQLHNPENTKQTSKHVIFSFLPLLRAAQERYNYLKSHIQILATY